MPDNRRDPRYRSSPARAQIEGISGGETYLRDISISGCCVEFAELPDIKPDTQYKICIIPEEESGIGDFEITVRSVWIRKGTSSGEIGFFILESPKGKNFERYVDYLAWRSSGSADTEQA